MKQIHGFTAKTMGGIYETYELNYSNPKVLAIKEKLGGFNYSPSPEDDGVKRKKRELITLDNGAKYEGEWNMTTNKREGKGY